MSFIDEWKGIHLPANRLRLLLRHRVEGLFAGEHLSGRLHEGMEFEQFKAYQPGDDVTKIDWRAFLRSRKLWVRQSPFLSNTVVHCVLDVSASMLYEEAGRSKWAYAQLLAAALGYLALQQGEGLRVWGSMEAQLKGGVVLYHLHALLHQLSRMRAGEKLPDLAEPKIPATKGQHLWMFFTDLYDTPASWVALWKRLRALGHEVHCWHILGEQEINASWKGTLVFKDLESKRIKKVHIDSYRKLYLAKMEAFLEEARQSCLQTGVHYHRLRLQEPIHRVLWQALG
ncbi:MAG: hypothetical protein KatS3mg033_1359 [Thermonema sp.]|uniref:DUF58 domain-containing protein n=1 Tax=Thermonema sp. TaxID=2231181 RepID=UPI0021DDBE50|nr:DUF58 domain-containing protein [Thermonema sp.]GIV39559.1 MAG: hypothetical protein KatS3mg033_1359 [Thermonema sp.]